MIERSTTIEQDYDDGADADASGDIVVNTIVEKKRTMIDQDYGDGDREDTIIEQENTMTASKQYHN